MKDYPYQAQLKQQLKAFLPPEKHQFRTLKGGGEWIYLHWRDLRDHIDNVAENWTTDYTEPITYTTGSQSYCVIKCHLTIENNLRTGIGSVETEILNQYGKDVTRGNPIDRAKAEAFRNASEEFGVGLYIQDQEVVCRYLISQNHLTFRCKQYLKKLRAKNIITMLGDDKQGENLWKKTIKKNDLEDCNDETFRFARLQLLKWQGTTFYDVNAEVIKTFWGQFFQQNQELAKGDDDILLINKWNHFLSEQINTLPPTTNIN